MFFRSFLSAYNEIKRHNGDSKMYSMEPRKVLQKAVVIGETMTKRLQCQKIKEYMKKLKVYKIKYWRALDH